MSSRNAVELRATYRLQLSSDFGFADARALVPYLRDLGISHLYLSPSLQARRGSTHGYDVVDPRHFSRELGGPEELRALSASARDAGMGIVLDVVPNHMAADDQNRYWAIPSSAQSFSTSSPGPAWVKHVSSSALSRSSDGASAMICASSPNPSVARRASGSAGIPEPFDLVLQADLTYALDQHGREPVNGGRSGFIISAMSSRSSSVSPASLVSALIDCIFMVA